MNYTGICKVSNTALHPEIKGRWLTLLDGKITNIFDNEDEAEQDLVQQIWKNPDYTWVGQVSPNIIKALNLSHEFMDKYILIADNQVTIISSREEAEDLIEELEFYAA